MKFGRFTVAAVAVTASLGLAACGGGGATTGASGGGTVKVGIKFDQPGMGQKAGADFTGMDVDLARYIATELKLGTPDFVEAVTAQRETLISTGQVKYIVGTYSISDARKEKVSFAGPYFIAGQDLLVRADDTSITGVESLAGKKLCSVKGSTSATNVKAKVPDVNLQEYQTYTLCVNALTSNTVDALTTDDTILAGYAAQEAYKGKVKVVGKTFSTENYGVGLAKADTAFCQQVTDALK
ncbi:MAG: transporter substrate-binding domain-containing protein, partial [Candidatus Phosphoribacter sp.]